MESHETIEKTIEIFISEYINKRKNLFGGMHELGESFLNTELKKYLITYKEKYSKIKTLLHGNTPVNLYDIYYPLKLFINKDTYYKTDDISNIFSETKKRITIIGEAGSGKSTLVKHLFLNSIATQYAIPILIELRDLNDTKGEIESLIYKTLDAEANPIREELVKRLLNKGEFLFFLDGFDEIGNKSKNDSIKNINTFANKHNKNRFVLTSRPYADAEYLPLFYNHRIGRLDTLNDIFGFINKQLSTDSDSRGIANKIIESIKANDHKYIFSFLTNPLLLAIYILTFQTNSLIPAKKHIFYQRVIIALFSEHDSRSKLSFARERLSNLTQEQIEDILSIFCIYSFFESKFEWDKEYINIKFKNIKSLDSIKSYQFETESLTKDLTLGISLWIEDGGILSFAHRTLQEYYTARFIKNLKAIENEKFYEVLIQKYIRKGNHPYLISLLSFLEEMDTFSFKKNFQLPILKMIRKIFKGLDREDLIISFLDYFGYDLHTATKLVIENKKNKLGKYIPIIDQTNVDLIIIFNNLGSNELFLDALQENTLEIKNSNKNDLPKSKHAKNFILSKKLFDICNETFYPTIDSFLNSINNEISGIENFIKSTEEEENNILKILNNL